MHLLGDHECSCEDSEVYGSDIMIRWIPTILFTCLSGVAVFSMDTIGVNGSGVRFGTTTECKVEGKPKKMVLTGAAMRTKYLVNVYAIASYIQEGTKAKTAEDLVNADACKQLHLVMERQVDGRDMYANFRSSILLNHQENEFAEQLPVLENLFKETKVLKGDQVKLTYIPGKGLHCHVIDKIEVTIPGLEFSKAIWEIYLGKKNLGDSIKKGLLSKI